jgi:hypothetical protein
MNIASHFFRGLQELEMEDRIRQFLNRYGDFSFIIDYQAGTVRFWRDTKKNAQGQSEHAAIKVSRGEENIFIWCFFLAIAQLAIDGQEAYEWVKYLYIDDPISSLDENNAIALAAHLARMLKSQEALKAVISTHHTLFFNVLCNEMGKAQRYFLRKTKMGYELQDTNETPQFYHVAMLKELHEAAKSRRLYTYHFTILRTLMEKTAVFLGYDHFGALLRRDPEDENGQLHARYLNLLSHGNYSVFEPLPMLEENKEIFCKILNEFMKDYPFNPDLFSETAAREGHA